MKYYTVGQINTYIKNMIDSDYLLKNVVIKGEVSNCKYHSMGHIYFSLKDETGSMPSVMFKSNVSSGLKFRLEDGQSIYVQGTVSVYERDGRYQLYARKIAQAEDTKGRLFAEYEKLKIRLNEEGLFDFDVKKKIPEYPKRVGIVTAETGAAVQDIMNIARRRNPYVQLILYPAKVQGEGAAETIVRGIRKLDKLGVDTIIVGRGGGSIEDLWAFNEEEVARAVFNAKTPIISAVGHEVDYTICDFVADKRAATPTAAAEMAVFEYDILRDSMINIESRLDNAFARSLDATKAMLDVYKNRLGALSPTNQLTQLMLRLSDINNRLDNAITIKLNETRHRLENDASKLDLLSPAKKLSSGFSYVVDDSGRNVTKASSLNVGDDITVYFSEGKALSRINKIEE